MSDFIFVQGHVDHGVLSNLLTENYDGIEVSIKEFNFAFGSVAFVENNYNGFKYIETDDYLFFVIGGPILDFCDNDFISVKDCSDGSLAIYNRWKVEKQITWHKDLNGPFVIFYLDKKQELIQLVTDLLSFIPLYYANSNSRLVLSTNVDLVAKIDKSKADNISIADFILNKVVTFPFTVYQNIFQLNPSSEFTYTLKSVTNFSNSFYWMPKEISSSLSNTRDIEHRLRESFINYISMIFKSKPRVACFLSGGEDSRAVISAIPNGNQVDSFIFFEKLNKEVNIATRVAKKLNSKITYFVRDRKHYLNIFQSACRLIGNSGDITHSHTLGISSELSLDKYDVVLGGFLSDTLLKGHHVQKRFSNGLMNSLPIPEIQSSTNSFNSQYDSTFNVQVLNDLNIRRFNHFRLIQTYRPNSAQEWFNIWPISMHLDFPNIHFNRRLFKSFEPFTFSEIVKVSAEAPINHKLNRVLFHNAMKPLFQRTYQIPHINGSYPFYPWYINLPLKYLKRVKTKVIKRLLKRSDECVFSDWNYLASLEEFNNLEEKFLPEFFENHKSIFSNGQLFYPDQYKKLNPNQKRIILQLAFNIKMLTDNYN